MTNKTNPTTLPPPAVQSMTDGTFFCPLTVQSFPHWTQMKLTGNSNLTESCVKDKKILNTVGLNTVLMQNSRHFRLSVMSTQNIRDQQEVWCRQLDRCLFSILKSL